MSTNWITLLALALFSLSLAVEASVLSVRVVDENTGEAVPGVRVIINHGSAPEPVNADMVQENRQFRPESLVVPKGSKVNFPNRDATRHHVYSF